MRARRLHLPDFFPYRLSILQAQVSRVVGSYYQREHGLSRNQWRVMAALAQQADMSATEIGAYVQLEKMAVSRAIKDCKARKLIRQRTDGEDRRCSRLSLTDKGLRCYQDIVPHVVAQDAAILNALSAEERRQLARISDKLLAHTAQLAKDIP